MRKLIRRRPSAALIVGVIALVMAMTGGAIAAKQIKLGALTDGAKNKTVGVGKLTYVTTTTNVPTNTQNVAVSATCPSGLRVIGGGIKLPEPPGNGDDDEFLMDSYPTTSGWKGRVANYDSLSGTTATTTAICAPSRVVTGAPPSS
jgi:hypothetical protein